MCPIDENQELVLGAIWAGSCFALSRLGVWWTVVLGFAASLAWAFAVDSHPISDFLTFHSQAARLAEGGDTGILLSSKSPPTAAYFAAFHAVLGSSYWVNWIAGAVAWSAGSVLVYHAVLPVLADARWARFVHACLALYPSLLAYAALPSSEAVFFLLLGAGAWLLRRAVDAHGVGRRAGRAALAGLAVGCLTLTRTNGLLLVLPCVVALGFGAAPLRGMSERAAPAVALVGAIALTLAAFGSATALRDGEFRIRPSGSSELALLFGTNRATRGGFSREDALLAGYGAADPLVRSRMPETARETALDRIAGDVPGFAGFALTDKVERLWARERPLMSYSAGGPEGRGSVNDYLIGGATLMADAAYRFVWLLFLGLLVLEIRRPTAAALLGGTVLLLALPHILIEVQPRYHVPMVPFMVVGAVVFLKRMKRRGEHQRVEV